MHNMVIQHFYTLQCDHSTNFSNHVSPCNLLTMLLAIFPSAFSLTSPLFLWVCFFLNYVCLFYIPHISKTMWYLFFSAWFIWLSTILTISIHVVLNGKISLLGLFGWSFTLGVCGQEAVAPYLFSLSVKRYAQGLWYRLWQIYHSREISYQVYLIFKI